MALDKLVFLVLFAILVVGISGCADIKYDGKEIAKEIPEFREFLGEFPDAGVTAQFIGQVNAEEMMGIITDKCGTGMETKAYIFVQAEEGANKALAWLDVETHEVECFAREYPIEDKCRNNEDCDEGDGCTKDTCSGLPKECSNIEITECGPFEGCCPEGCTHDNDYDCGQPAAGAKCETDADCDDGLASTIDECRQDLKECWNTEILACITGDGYCPAGCAYERDKDCTYPGEDKCSGSWQCFDDEPCTTDICEGVPKECVHHEVSACKDGDSCCPSGCGYNNDKDCGFEQGDTYDCVKDMQCLAEKALDCTEAKARQQITLDLSGVLTTTDTYYEILGEENGECLLYMRTNDAFLQYGQGLINSMLQQDLNRDYINDHQHEANDAVKDSIGKDGNCYFSDNSGLSSVLSRWGTGSFTGGASCALQNYTWICDETGDLANAECTGERFIPSEADMGGGNCGTTDGQTAGGDDLEKFNCFCRGIFYFRESGITVAASGDARYSYEVAGEGDGCAVDFVMIDGGTSYPELSGRGMHCEPGCDYSQMDLREGSECSSLVNFLFLKALLGASDSGNPMNCTGGLRDYYFP